MTCTGRREHIAFEHTKDPTQPAAISHKANSRYFFHDGLPRKAAWLKLAETRDDLVAP